MAISVLILMNRGLSLVKRMAGQFVRRVLFLSQRRDRRGRVRGAEPGSHSCRCLGSPIIDRFAVSRVFNFLPGVKHAERTQFPRHDDVHPRRGRAVRGGRDLRHRRSRQALTAGRRAPDDDAQRVTQ